jgi:hypothetical protein
MIFVGFVGGRCTASSTPTHDRRCDEDVALASTCTG